MKPARGPLPKLLEVRGEVIYPRKAFERLNAERVRNRRAGVRESAQRRGRIATPARSEITASRPLDIFCYSPGVTEGVRVQIAVGVPAGDQGARAARQSADAGVLATSMRCSRYWNELTERRHELDYEADGVVAKVNSFALQEQLGEVSRSPRWAIAYKFKAQQAETVCAILSVQVGRIGSLTPVAKLEPVAARRCDDLERLVAQPRRDSPQGRARWRHRPDRARRRRDSLRRARDPAGGSARDSVPDADALPGMRRRHRARRRRGRVFLRQRELPGADARIDSPFRLQDRRWISTGSATSWSGRLVEKGLVKELDDIYDLTKEQHCRARADGRQERAESDRGDRTVAHGRARPRHQRARHPPRRGTYGTPTGVAVRARSKR